MDPEEQRRIDDEARRAADEAESRALAAFAEETAPQAASRRIELPEQRVDASHDVAMEHGYAAPDAPNTDDFTDPSTGTASPIAPFDSEQASPLGDRQSGGTAIAPSGHVETDDGRWARLGLGGDFRDAGRAVFGDPLEPGNVDLHSRPRVDNGDGSYSTVRSMSFGNDHGEVLVPTVSDDGRILSDDDARASYDRTGRHLGIFANPHDATQYAEQLHSDQAAEYDEPDPESLALEQMGDHPGAHRLASPMRQPAAAPSSPSEQMALEQMHSAPVAPRAPSAFARWSAAPSPIASPPPPVPAAAAAPIAAPSSPATPTGKPAMDPAREAAAGPLPRLDEGLPSEGDIAGARDNPLVSFLHHLQNGLRGAIGRPTRDYDARGDALAQERRTGLTQRMAGKATERRADAAASATAERQSRQDAVAQQGLALRERSVAAQEAMIPTRQASMQASTERTQALTEETRAESTFASATREQRADPSSAASIGEREALEARLRIMNPAAAEAVRAGLSVPLAQLNADQIHEIRGSLTSGVGIRGAGSGGGGDGGARRSAQIAEMQARLGMSAEEAERHRLAVGSDAVERELAGTQSLVAREGGAAQRARAPLAEGEQGPELLQGLHAGVSLEPGEARAARTAFRSAADSMAAIGGLEQIGSEFGWRGSFTPEAIQRARPRLMQMRHMAALIQGTGVINPTEVPVIDAAIADPTSLAQVSFQTFGAALAEWRQIMHENLRNALGDTGYAVQEGVDAALQRFERAGHGGATDSPRTRTQAPAPAEPAAPAEDISQMSDDDIREELRALDEGGD